MTSLIIEATGTSYLSILEDDIFRTLERIESTQLIINPRQFS